MQEQMQEVEDLKQYLSKSRVNISAEILTKAIVLPEELEMVNGQRQYPKMGEMLF